MQQSCWQIVSYICPRKSGVARPTDGHLATHDNIDDATLDVETGPSGEQPLAQACQLCCNNGGQSKMPFHVADGFFYDIGVSR